jgi:hypothetical protein
VETASNWRKSSYSGANGGECIEVASTTGAVKVRDTQNRDGQVLAVHVSAWREFVSIFK